MKYKIIIDSSCDLTKEYLQDTGVDFAVVPFVVNVGDKEFIDDQNVDVNELLTALENYDGNPISACPSPQAYIDELTGADKYFIITISSKLSGSHNSALIAKNSHSNPSDVCVIDSKLAGCVQTLIVDKIVALIAGEISYEQICDKIITYVNEQIDVLFTFKDYSNFVKNGRLTPMQAVIAQTLRITPICTGVDGEIKIAKKLLGSKRVFKEMLEMIKERKNKYSFSKCVISHVDNLDTAKEIQAEIQNLNLFSKIEVMPMRGLCTFYAMRKGIIIGFEKI